MLAAIYWQYPQGWPWAVAVATVGVLIAGVSYGSQFRKSASGPLMFCLRSLGFFVLAATLLRPVVIRTRQASDRGPVLILLDDSLSMSAVDTTRGPAQWVAIAEALGRIPTADFDSDAAAVLGACDRLSSQADAVARARDVLEYAELANRGTGPAAAELERAVAVLVDRANAAEALRVKRPAARPLGQILFDLSHPPAGTGHAGWLQHVREKARAAVTDAENARFADNAAAYRNNEAVRAACLPVQSLSRAKLVHAAVYDPRAGLLARMGGETARVMSVGEKLVAADAATEARPDAAVTNLSGGIRAAVASVRSGPVRAIVLLSDGRQTVGDPAGFAFSTPVFAVNIASRAAVKDVVVSAITVPLKLFVDEPATARVDVRQAGFNGASVEVTFNDGESAQKREVNFADEKPVAISFPIKPTSAGPRLVEVSVTELADEASTLNNRTRRTVLVVDHSYDRGDGKNPGLVLDADAATALPTEGFRVRCRWTGPVPGRECSIEVTPSSGAARKIPMASDGAGRFKLQLPPLPTGDYKLRAVAGDLSSSVFPLRVVVPGDNELVDLNGDEGFLRRLAESSGGQYFRLDQIDTVPRRIAELPVDLSEPVELPLWDGPYPIALVLGCFATEWAVRRRVGLA